MVLVAVMLMAGLLSMAGLGMLALAGRDTLITRHRLEQQHLRHLAYGALHLAAAALTDASFHDALRGDVRLQGSDPSTVTSYALMPDRVVELSSDTAWLTCGRRSLCSDADRRRTTTARPWGPRNPRWVIVLQGPASRWWPGAWHRGSVVVVWIGDDAREVDGDPARDDSTGPATGQGMVRLYAMAYGVSGGRQAIEAELIRYCEPSQAECQTGLELSGQREVNSEL
jgi:hypothetical protein